MIWSPYSHGELWIYGHHNWMSYWPNQAHSKIGSGSYYTRSGSQQDWSITSIRTKNMENCLSAISAYIFEYLTKLQVFIAVYLLWMLFWNVDVSTICRNIQKLLDSSVNMKNRQESYSFVKKFSRSQYFLKERSILAD